MPKHRFRISENLVVIGERRVTTRSRYGFRHTRRQRTYSFREEVNTFVTEQMAGRVKLGSLFRGNYYCDFRNERDAVAFKLRFGEDVR